MRSVLQERFLTLPEDGPTTAGFSFAGRTTRRSRAANHFGRGRSLAMRRLLGEESLDGLIEAGPAAELEATTLAMAQKIVARSAHAIALGKDMFYRQLPMDLADAYAYASERMTCNMDSHDAREGIDAFIQKRKPEWKGK